MAGPLVSRVRQMVSNSTQLQLLLLSPLPLSLLSPVRRYLYQIYRYGIFRTIDTPASPAILTNDLGECRYRLDNDTSAIFAIPDGRELGYAQYGSQIGRAVFYCHGLPGSRIEAAAWDEVAVKLGARIIAVDRPGMGWSSPHPGRTLLDHAKDIDHLAEYLEVDKYGVML